MANNFDFSVNATHLKPELNKIDFRFGREGAKPRKHHFNFKYHQPSPSPSIDRVNFNLKPPATEVVAAFSDPFKENLSPLSCLFEENIPIVVDGIQVIFNKEFTENVSPIMVLFGNAEEPEQPEIPISNPNISMGLSLSWGVSPRLVSSTALTSEAIPLATYAMAQWLSPPLVASTDSLHWQTGTYTASDHMLNWASDNLQNAVVGLQWGSSKAVTTGTWISWVNSLSLVSATTVNFRVKGDKSTSHSAIVWEQGDPSVNQFNLWFNNGHQHLSSNVLSWGPHAPRWICSTKYIPPPIGPLSINFNEPFIVHDGVIDIRFTASPKVCVFDDGGGLINAAPVLPSIDFKLPVEPQLRRAYIMQPTISCVRVSDNANIIISSFSISDSRSQFAAGASLTFQSEVDAKRAENELLMISVNGYEFYVLCETPSKSNSFGAQSFSSSCRGRVAELSEPYQLPISYQNPAARSLSGVLGDMLQYTGWTVALNGVADFVIPQGAFSTANLSPIASVHEAVEQIGCMLSCDDENKVITVLPKWPTVPWLAASADPDITLHDSVIFSHSESEKVTRLCDACWLRGEQQGVSVKVKRQGTAGAVATADISAQVIVDNQAAIVAGTNAIAETGRKRIHNITAPIMADLPPLKKGMLVAIREGALLFRGVVDRTEVTANVDSKGAKEITQSFTLIESLE